MKLELGRTVIETNNIEFIEKTDDHTVEVHFISGKLKEIDCDNIFSTSRATWDGNADDLMQIILGIESDEND